MSDDQCCSVRGRNDPARVQLCVFFSFASILKSFILKLDMAMAIILGIFVQDCSFLKRVPMYQPNNTYMPGILKIRSRSSIQLQILE